MSPQISYNGFFVDSLFFLGRKSYWLQIVKILYFSFHYVYLHFVAYCIDRMSSVMLISSSDTGTPFFFIGFNGISVAWVDSSVRFLMYKWGHSLRKMESWNLEWEYLIGLYLEPLSHCLASGIRLPPCLRRVVLLSLKIVW